MLGLFDFHGSQQDAIYYLTLDLMTVRDVKSTPKALFYL
jgi:hypothetical protein